MGGSSHGCWWSSARDAWCWHPPRSRCPISTWSSWQWSSGSLDGPERREPRRPLCHRPYRPVPIFGRCDVALEDLRILRFRLCHSRNQLPPGVEPPACRNYGIVCARVPGTGMWTKLFDFYQGGSASSLEEAQRNRDPEPSDFDFLKNVWKIDCHWVNASGSRCAAKDVSCRQITLCEWLI